MRIAVLCIAALFPVAVAASTAVPKDKYIDCNCHITPAVSWKGGPVSEHKAVKHHHKSGGVKKAAVTPPPATPPKHKKVHHQQAHITPVGDGYPGNDAFITSNKLALPAGKSIYAPGELVYISGRVLDMKCVPVSDAIVEIWQTNPDGQYVKTTLGERLSPNPTFTGNGKTTTDNLGRFNFVTVFPGTVGGRAPFIHVHVIHKDFPTLDTEMFFADDRRNASDPVLSTLPNDQRDKLTAKVWERNANNPSEGLGASWDISLNGKNPWRHF